MLVPPRKATEQEILSFHTPAYVDAVARLSRGDTSMEPSRFNFGPGDNPVYEGMYEAAAWSTGASLRAADLLMSDEADVAFSISGGLHHAMADRASGFCVFNDPVIAINSMVARGMRVAYVDVDCHHGDGVQHAFYETDAVLTVSTHESGAYLFPGTGVPRETGAGRGEGYSVNLPLFPYTSDDVYLWAFGEVVPPLVTAFGPDVLVTQLGVDSHFSDPITHLGLTVQGIERVVAELAKLAQGKWLALGGGGYNVQAVARAWAMAYGVMSGRRLADEVPDTYRSRYGVTTLRDRDAPRLDDSVKKQTRDFAEASVREVQRLVFPVHGIGAS
jgi:acetoin utilization protein AcuC